MKTLKVTLWSDGRDPSKCGVQIGTRLSFEDLDAITSRQETEAAGVPTVLLNEYRGNWHLFGIWLEDRAVCGIQVIQRADLQEFRHRLSVRQRSIGIAIAKLLEDNKSARDGSTP